MPNLHFKGKAIVKNHHHAVPFHSLEVNAKASLGNSQTLDDNLIIQGDNLVALKALLPTHAGQVKCIYIDPPYNTGNEGWIYNDAVNSPLMQQWLGKEVDAEDLQRHDKWCCMMYPRLQLLRELLREDGVIFVSIDDNEVAHLRLMMDEIFGEENFVGELIWEKKYAPQNDAKYFSKNHESLLCYGKQKENFQRNMLPMTAEQKARYKNPDNDPRGPWQSDNLSVATYNAATDFEITTPSGNKARPPAGYCWRFSKEKLAELQKDNRIYFGAKIPRLKRFLSEVGQGKVPISLWYHAEVGHTQSATQALKDIFDGEKKSDYPKPVDLVKRCIQLATQPGDLVLDSFAGSGTTAHAVLALNAEEQAAAAKQKETLNLDGAAQKPAGGRRFILVECEDYANTITAERVRRVAKGVPAAKDELLQKGLGGSFAFCTLSAKPLSADNLLGGKDLPAFKNLARHVFYTATGSQPNETDICEEDFFCGKAPDGRPVYLLYAPNTDQLKKLVLDLPFAEKIATDHPKIEKFVFAPQTFLEEWELREKNISFTQLPFIPGL